VRAALAAPARSHLDPEMMALLDDLRARLGRVFHAGDASFSFAVSGTGSSGMETAVANVTGIGMRALVVVNGYFGERLASMLARYGADVTRVEGEWGRAIDPAAIERELAKDAFEIVAVVHAETSTGVRNPLQEIAALAAKQDALVLVDAVTSLGAMPLDAAAWGLDVVYSCSQKGLGAPSGLAPVTFSSRALARRAPCRSFYFDLTLLEDYWVRRKYHHTISAPLIYALSAALDEIDEEGLAARWRRHEDVHRAFVDALASMSLSLLPPPDERLWSLNAVRVPDGVNEAAVRQSLLAQHGIEIGAGLGPLAGKIWRVGLMGSGATRENVQKVSAALASSMTSVGAR
jgi:alanine-glyoxylate transaminase/serine-glyoxylate transaminase/serine-pyruvate transaminase